MEAGTYEPDQASIPESQATHVRRGNTGVRILLTLLFAVIWGVLESVLGVVVLFSIGWALISRQAPPRRLREVSNSLVAYSYRIWRYLTYAEPQVPFPFSDFPEALEPLGDLGDDDAPEVRNLIGSPLEDDDVDDD